MKANKTADAANAKLPANPLAKLLAALQIKSAKRKKNNFLQIQFALYEGLGPFYNITQIYGPSI